MLLPQLIAAVAHFAAQGLLLYHILLKHTCQGVSLVTLQLYLIIFASRYSHILAVVLSVETTFFALLHIAATLVCVLLIRFSPSIHASYATEADIIPTWFLPIPALGLAMLFASSTLMGPLLLEFSLYLEALALIPQFTMQLRLKKYDKWVVLYVFLMGLHSCVLNADLFQSEKREVKVVGVVAVQGVVFVVGLLLVSLQQWRLQVHEQKVVEAVEAEKPDFQQVWSADSFQFADEKQPTALSLLSGKV